MHELKLNYKNEIKNEINIMDKMVVRNQKLLLKRQQQIRDNNNNVEENNNNNNNSREQHLDHR